MTKSLILLALTTAAGFAQYKAEPAGAPPSEVAPAIASTLQQGTKVLNAAGTPWCEVWFRGTMPAGPKPTETDSVAFPTVPHGALLGVIRFPAAGADRRGQNIKPGVYTLRYALYPINGDH